MNTFRIKNLRFRILKGGKIGLSSTFMMFGILANTMLNANTITSDGNGTSGIFVGDEFYNNTNTNLSGTTHSYNFNNLSVGNNIDTTIFTGYYTEGGAGSGGGAGLGGVFFVDKNSTLTLTNTIFSFNKAKGGEGGSLPAQAIADKSLYVNQTTTSLDSYDISLISPELNYSNGQYNFNTVNVSTGTTLLSKGSQVNFSGIGESSIESTTENSVVLKNIINIGSDKVKTINKDFYSVNGKTITFDYTGGNIDANDAEANINANVIKSVTDNIVHFGIVAFNNGSTAQSTTIQEMTYDDKGRIKSIILKDALTITPITGLDALSVSGFKSKPYTINGNTITIADDTQNFEVGMMLYDDKGVTTGSKITSVTKNSDGKYVLEVDTTSNLSSLNTIVAKTSPFINTTTIKLSSPDDSLVNASKINVNGNEYNISNYDKTTGTITLSTGVDSEIIKNIESGKDILTVTLSTVTLSGNTITLLDEGQKFNVGMKIEGTELTITSVTKSGDKIIVLTSGDVTSLDKSNILAIDPLSTGGSLNNLGDTGTKGTNGKNGISANYDSSDLNSGDGVDGRNGYAASNGNGSIGGSGGAGGNGSSGLSSNSDLEGAVSDAKIAVAQAATDLAIALIPEGVPFPVPEIADIGPLTAATVIVGKQLDDAKDTLKKWKKQLALGLVGIGGNGGNGGDGGNGSEFFGGGNAGDGGNGGDGAISVVDGGDGGNGGEGGSGGFGAGGGSGGAGGNKGSNGAASDGDSGNGGLAGFGAGTGSNGDGLNGNGGSGFGGAVFVRDNATLNIVGNALFENNSTESGSSNNGGESGKHVGSAIFMMKGSTVNLMPGFGNKITFNEDIADNSKSSYDSASFASGAGSDIHIRGNGGLVEFNATNTYSGKTIIEGSTLSAKLGQGININSKIVFAGTGTTTTTSDSLSLASSGTLLIKENLTNKRVGTNNENISWEGSGGLASGLTEGIKVNLGQITENSSQILTWGTNGFFQNHTDNVLTFGSEQSLGAVDFQNNVNIGSLNTARIGVYNTKLTNNTDSSTAILSANWIGNELMVGSANYTGNLVLKGTNKLNNLTILNGTTITAGSGTISNNTINTNISMKAGDLVLNNSETLNNVSIDDGATLISKGDLKVKDEILNNGNLIINTANTDKDIINNKSFVNNGELTVSGNIINDNTVDSTSAQWNQVDKVSAKDIINNKTWYNQSNVTLSGQLLNNGTWYSGQKDEEQDAYLAYVDSTKNVISLATLTGTGTFDITNGDLEINQSGASTFAGDITGKGMFEKSGVGTLTISKAQEFAKLNISTGKYISNGEHSLNSALVDINGQLDLNANLTTGTNFENNGTTTLTANRTITATGGLKGSATGLITITDTDINTNTSLILSQTGDTTYTGKIQGTGSFIKTGVGNLTLDGAVGNIDLDSGIYVNAGTLTTVLEKVFAANQNITVNNAGILHVKTGAQTVSTLTNSGIVNQDKDITLTTLTNNPTGKFNQKANINSTDAVMNGTWNVIGDADTDTKVLNTTTLTGNATVLLVDYLNDTTTISSNLKINQSGNSIFGGSIGGNGSIEKTGVGALGITAAQTFIGGLNVTGGTIETKSFGTLADSLNVHVSKDSIFVAGVVDTVNSILIDAKSVGINAGKFDLNANITTQEGLKNDGQLDLNANLTIGTNFENNGTTTLTANRTITATGGLKGSGDIDITNIDLINPTGLTLNQTANTTYNGTIKGTGSFKKEGTGTLTLNGLANSIDLGSGLIIDNGILALDGDYILAAALDVLINNNGTMQLINGNQKIDALAGAGSIDLGTNNKLEVNKGGKFSGKVIGTGTLDIKSGDFEVADDIVSEEENSSFNVGSGSTTTITQDSVLTFPTVAVQGILNVTGTTNATTVTVEGSGILNVIGTTNATTIIVQDSGTLDVTGTVEASKNVVVNTSGTLHLTNGGNINTNLASIYGTLNGIGSISGTTTAHNGSYLKPGNSPGSITFDNLILDNNSTTVMEIETTANAGTTFDQIKVDNNLTIKNGAILNLIKYGAGLELTQGEKAKIFNFTPGNIKGFFGDITSTYSNNVILNLQTGEVVGLGGTTISQFENTISSNANQMNILDNLKMNETNGVAQYYGGELASRLASNQGNTVEIQKIFEKFSPEAYSSLLEQNKFNLINSTSKLPINLENTKTGLSISMDRNTYETKENVNSIGYNIEGNEIKIDHTGKFHEGFIVTSINAIDGDINSKYMSATTKNYGINIAMVQPLGSKNLTFRSQASYMKGDTDLSRETYDSKSYANSISSSGIMAGVGLGYDKKFENVKLATTLDVLYYNSTVDGFKESNVNSLDALNILKQDESGIVSKVKIKVTKDLTENLSISGKAEYSKFFNSDKNKVSANVALEDTLFSVENEGLGKNIIGLGMGLDYKVNKEWSAEFNVGISGDKDLTQNNNVGLQLKYAF